MSTARIIPVELNRVDPFDYAEPDFGSDSERMSPSDEAPVSEERTFGMALEALPPHGSMRHLLAAIAAEKGFEAVEKSEIRNLIFAMKPKSKWYSEQYVGQEELYEACEKVLNDLKLYDQSKAFWHKVTTREAPDYFSVIKRPMDYGTMRKKLAHYIYKTRQEFVDDLNLIYDNCLTYNTHPSSIYRTAANFMRDKTDRLLHTIPDVQVRLRQEVEAEEKLAQENERKRKLEEEAFQASKRRRLSQLRGVRTAAVDNVEGHLENDKERLPFFRPPPCPSSPARPVFLGPAVNGHPPTGGGDGVNGVDRGEAFHTRDRPTPSERGSVHRDLNLQPDGQMVELIRSNIKILEMIRVEYQRIWALKEEGVLNGGKAISRVAPRSYEYATLDKAEIHQKGFPRRLGHDTCIAIVQKTLAEILAHSGFESVTTGAMEILTDAYLHCFHKLGKSARMFGERFGKRHSPGVVIRLALREHGFTPANLFSHLHHNLFKYSQKIVDLRRKLGMKLHELLATETDEDEIDIHEEGEELFVSGSLFDEVLQEDFFGLNELGVGATNMPQDIWYKGRQRPAMLKRLRRRKDKPQSFSERAPKYPIPPKFPVPDLDKVIGLMRPFLEVKFANNETVEDEYLTAKQKASRQRARARGISPWLRKVLAPKDKKVKRVKEGDIDFDKEALSNEIEINVENNDDFPSEPGLLTAPMSTETAGSFSKHPKKERKRKDTKSESPQNSGPRNSSEESTFTSKSQQARPRKERVLEDGGEPKQIKRKRNPRPPGEGGKAKKARIKKAEAGVAENNDFTFGLASDPTSTKPVSAASIPPTLQANQISPGQISSSGPSAGGSLKDILSGKSRPTAPNSHTGTSMVSRVREQLAQNQSLAKLMGSSSSSGAASPVPAVGATEGTRIKDIMKRDSVASVAAIAAASARAAATGKSPSLEELLSSASSKSGVVPGPVPATGPSAMPSATGPNPAPVGTKDETNQPSQLPAGGSVAVAVTSVSGAPSNGSPAAATQTSSGESSKLTGSLKSLFGGQTTPASLSTSRSSSCSTIGELKAPDTEGLVVPQQVHDGDGTHHRGDDGSQVDDKCQPTFDVPGNDANGGGRVDSPGDPEFCAQGDSSTPAFDVGSTSTPVLDYPSNPSRPPPTSLTSYASPAGRANLPGSPFSSSASSSSSSESNGNDSSDGEAEALAMSGKTVNLMEEYGDC